MRIYTSLDLLVQEVTGTFPLHEARALQEVRLRSLVRLKAQEDLTHAVTEAHQLGLSHRVIGEAGGLSHMTVARWVQAAARA